jgi:hypothetical protein
MLFKEIIAVKIENHTKPINAKCRVTDYQSSWYINLPLGFKGLSGTVSECGEVRHETVRDDQMEIRCALCGL